MAKSFSPLRAYLWPIHGFELRKFLPLLFMAFFIGFNYNILRNMKDALLVTAEFSGALMITFIYSRLNNHLTRDRVFYAMVGIFLSFFALFTFVIYPLQNVLHPHETANFLQSHLPSGFMGLIAMFRYWTFSSFYIMCELWSSAILSMLFWGFANEVTLLGEAKRFYGLIAIGLNLAAISSGQASVFLTSDTLHNTLHLRENSWDQSLILLTYAVIFSGMAILFIYRFLTKKVLHHEASESTVASQKAPKIHMSMRENFKYLAKSKYLLSIAVIVFAYNIVINLTEVIWKDQVKQLYPLPNDYNAYMSQITTITGIISFFASLFISGQLIRRFGWTFTALTIPIILLVTSVGFFCTFFGREGLVGLIVSLGTSPLTLVVFFGSAQNCMCRAAKFTLFDATKEMAFIPLNKEGKLKGKAVIDGVGSRLGKSGGSLIHQILLIIFSTISASAHIVAIILFIVIGFWISAVVSLGKRFNALTTVKPATNLAEALDEKIEKTKEEALNV